MKLSTMTFAAVLAAVAAAAMASDGAFAAAGTKPKTYKLNASDPNAEKVCTDLGGTITTAKDGSKLCTLPANVVPPAQTMRESPN